MPAATRVNLVGTPLWRARRRGDEIRSSPMPRCCRSRPAPGSGSRRKPAAGQVAHQLPV